MVVKVRIPGDPHIYFIYVPSEKVVAHVSGLDPLRDGTLIEAAIRVALVGLSTGIGTGVFADARTPFFATVHKAVWLNVPAATHPIRRTVEITMCPVLTGIEYRYIRRYVTIGDDDEGEWELKEEEYLNPFYGVEEYDDSEPLVLLKPAGYAVNENGRLYVLVLYRIENKELNRSDDVMELGVKAIAVGYVPAVISFSAVCEGEMHHRCGLDIDGSTLWSRRFTINVYEELFEEGHAKEEEHVLALLKHGNGFVLKYALNRKEKSMYEGRSFNEKALSKAFEYYVYVVPTTTI